MKCNMCDKEVDVLFSEMELEGTIHNVGKENIGTFNLKIQMNKGNKFCKYCLQQDIATLAEHIKNNPATSIGTRDTNVSK